MRLFGSKHIYIFLESTALRFTKRAEEMKLFSKRIELNLPLSRSIRFRLSRTNLPMPALSWHPFRGFSLNTRHGASVAKTFSGITLGFQNTRFTFKGRWESRLFGINLNLSKSGFSLSQRNMLGTYNFSNPNRSSANLFGVQIRGKKAAPWALLGLLMSLPLYSYDALVALANLLLVISKFIVNIFIILLNLFISVFRFILSLFWYMIVAIFCLIVPDNVFDPGAENEDKQ